jgi:hypothetical protein
MGERPRFVLTSNNDWLHRLRYPVLLLAARGIG